MSKPNNYCIIESEFLMSDDDFLSLSRSERYVFICAWNYAVFRRSSAFVRSEFESNLARLYDLRRRTVADTLQKCGENARLIVINGDTLFIPGVEDKHKSLKGWSVRKNGNSRTDNVPNPEPTERRERRGKKAPGFAEVKLPYGEGFARAWSDWAEYRKEIRQTLTPTSTARQIKKLAGYESESTAIAVLEQSMENGWTGLFDIKGKPKRNEPEPNYGPVLN